MNERRGYSLLELLIALGLVGALLAVAWSLLSTYQRAELTAWNLVERTQAVRLVRDSLERDLLQIVFPETQAKDASSSWLEDSDSDTGFDRSNPKSLAVSKSESKFYGNSYGFTTLVKPSVDPMPVFQQLLNVDNGHTSEKEQDWNSVRQHETDRPRIESSGLLATQPITLEYRIRPESGWGNQPTLPSAATGFDRQAGGNQRWLLVRSALLEYPNWSSESADDLESSDRELTASDLYRGIDNQQSRSIPLQHETVIARLGRAKFSYFDGSSWQNSWSTDAPNHFPKAVALTFDFVKSSGPPTRVAEAMPEIDSESTFDSIQESNGFPEADWSTDSEEFAETIDEPTATGDLRVVIRLWQAPTDENRVDE